MLRRTKGSGSLMRDIFEEIFENQPLDPEESVRRSMRPNLRARFYQAATVGEGRDGFAVLLDGRIRARITFGRTPGNVRPDTPLERARIRSLQCEIVLGGMPRLGHAATAATGPRGRDAATARAPAGRQLDPERISRLVTLSMAPAPDRHPAATLTRP